jgi:hypothetical protein
MVDLALLQSVSYIAGALGVCVAAIFYILNLRISQRNSTLAIKMQEQTLETRQAQLFMGIFQIMAAKEFQTDFEELVNQWKWSDNEDYTRKYGSQNVAENGKQSSIFKLYDGVGTLVRHGLINSELVYDLSPSGVISLWEKWLPVVTSWREDYSAPQILRNFEFLYGEMMRIRVARGHPVPLFGRVTQ